MATKNKNELIICDYCRTEKISAHIYTAKKHFSNCKIPEILYLVTRRTIPATIRIKLCTICVSTLLATAAAIAKADALVAKLLSGASDKKQNGAIEKADELLAKLLSGASDKKQNTETDPKTEAHVENAVTSTEAPSVGQSSAKKKPAIKNKSLSDGTPNTPKANLLQTSTPIAAPLTLTNGTSTPVQELVKAKLPKTTTPKTAPSTPNKQQCLDSLLQNAVKLTPAKDDTKKSKAFIQLFGKSVNKTEDIDEDKEKDDKDDDDVVVQKSVPKNIAKNFECKNCDYNSVHATAMKTHYKEMHGQKRPRIFDCLVCTKTFGRLSSLKMHLKEHGLVEENKENKGKPASSASELATFTALKHTHSAKNDDISFNVPATLSSTQKFTVADEQKLQCELCHLEFTKMKTLEEHMTKVHYIERPKLFKCNSCLVSFLHKWSLDRHIKQKHANNEDTINTQPDINKKVRRQSTEITSITPTKITKRRKTIQVELTPAKEPKVNVEKTSPVKQKIDESPLDLTEDDFQPEVNVEKTSPAKQKRDESPEDVNEEDFNDILEKTFIDVIDEPIEHHVKTPSASEPMEHHIKSPSASPSKRNAKENSQLAKSKIATPKKEKTSVSGELPPRELLTSFIKPIPKENGKDILLEHTSNKKKKSKSDKEMLDSPQSATTVTNGSPTKKSSKRKFDTQLENLSQDDTANTTIYDSSTQDTQNLDLETIDLMDEINTNVKPHKRAKLDSINESELSCNMCTKVVSSRKRLDSHIEKRHATKFKCPNCNFGSTKSKDYVSHFKTCNSGTGLPCGVKKCKKSFQTVQYLKSHLDKKHSVE